MIIIKFFLILPAILCCLQLGINYNANGGFLILSIVEVLLKSLSLFMWFKFKDILSLHQLLSFIVSISNTIFYLSSSDINTYMIVSYSINMCLTIFVSFLNTTTTKIEFNKVTPEKEWICSICLDTDKKLIVKTNCSHTFHLKCIEKSLDYSKLCPMCRAEIV